MSSTYYVLYPRGVRTGGPEALHELVHTMRGMGLDAYLVPTPGTEHSERVQEYRRYSAPERPEILDEAGAAVIAPEVSWDLLKDVHHATRYLWWLSIDSAGPFKAQRQLERWERKSISYRGRLKRFLRVAKSVPDRIYLRGQGITHLVQSDFAGAYLARWLGMQTSIVSDFIRVDDLPQDADFELSRHSRVAFNPTKGREAIQLVMDRAPKEIEWLALEGLSRAEMIEALQSSAIYLDLGHHPGRDRIPREAAMCGALTLVAARGAGAKYEDVPIPDEHKIALRGNFAALLVTKLQESFEDLESEVIKQDFYRQTIRKSEEQFGREVADVFVHRKLGRRTIDYLG